MDELIALIESDETIVAEMTEQGPAGRDGVCKIIVTAAEPLGGHRVATLDGRYGDNTEPSHTHRLAGITKNAVDVGESVVAVFAGEIEEPSWNWNTNLPLFLGANGLLTQSCPATGLVRIMAWPITATKIMVSMREPIQQA
jgi:hypothetical protein